MTTRLGYPGLLSERMAPAYAAIRTTQWLTIAVAGHAVPLVEAGRAGRIEIFRKRITLTGLPCFVAHDPTSVVY